MDLSKDISYSKPVKNEIGLINPVRNELDDQLFELAKELEQLPLARRDEIQTTIGSTTSWTLVTFASRAAVFALRDEDPKKTRASFTMLGMALVRNDPRDIIIAANRILYVAAKLSVAVPDSLHDRVTKSDRHMRQMLGTRFEREREEYMTARGFRQVRTRFGIGLVDSDSAPYQPECDLLEAAIDIVELVKSDPFYSSVHVKIESGNSQPPNRGALSLTARPDPDAHPDMKYQMFHIRLFEYPDEATLNQHLIGKANSKELNHKVSHQNLLFTAVARSYVQDIANVENEESLQRFAEPVQAILAVAVKRGE